MLLVVFGAGASHDSVHKSPSQAPQRARRSAITVGTDEDFRPPLASQLFDTRAIFETVRIGYPDSWPLISQLRNDSTPVEEQLTKFQQQSISYAPLRKRLAAIRYYLRFALWECQDQWLSRVHRGHTNHVTLMHEIDLWRSERNEEVCFVTFNYDTLIEDAIRDCLKFSGTSIDSYIKWPQYSVIKLHGSVNWGAEVEPDLRLGYPQTFIDLVDEIRPTGGYRVITKNRLDSKPTQTAPPVVPAIAIPLRGKDEFLCPDDHLGKLKAVLPKVTKILTVGWRGAETKFVDLLGQMLRQNPVADLLVVSAGVKDAKEARDNLRLWGSSRSENVVVGNVKFFDKGFSALIDDISALEEFLRKPLGGINDARYK